MENDARQGGLDSQALLAAVPKLPPAGEYLWNYFHQLSATRRRGEWGPVGLTRAEIHDWEQDEGISLERWERRTILAIDASWLTVIHKAQAADRKP